MRQIESLEYYVKKKSPSKPRIHPELIPQPSFPLMPHSFTICVTAPPSSSYVPSCLPSLPTIIAQSHPSSQFSNLIAWKKEKIKPGCLRHEARPVIRLPEVVFLPAALVPLANREAKNVLTLGCQIPFRGSLTSKAASDATYFVKSY